MDSMEIRRNAIVSLINEKGSVSFGDLKETFHNVSEMTLRTDLKALDKQGMIVRIHGGAKSVGTVQSVISKDDFLNKRAILNTAEKQLIAQKAIRLLQPDETIFLDSGSTTTMMAASIPDEPRLIYTSGLTCAIELASLTKPRICLPGGILNRYSHSVCGVSAIRELERIHFKQAFIGVTSFSYDTGFSCSIDEEARLKQLAIEHAQEVILLMDSSKLQKHSTFTFAQLKNVDIIVSDGKLPHDFVAHCQKQHVKVI